MRALQPTQMCVGLAEVWSRQRDFGQDSQSERLNYLRRKPVPLVRNRAVSYTHLTLPTSQLV